MLGEVYLEGAVSGLPGKKYPVYRPRRDIVIPKRADTAQFDCFWLFPDIAFDFRLESILYFQKYFVHLYPPP
jgi:hypothetical protein